MSCEGAVGGFDAHLLGAEKAVWSGHGGYSGSQAAVDMEGRDGTERL